MVLKILALVLMLIVNYRLVSSATKKIKIKNLQSLIMSISNFVLVMSYFIILPITDGYSYSSFQDMIDKLFAEGYRILPITTIIGFSIAIAGFAFDTVNEICENKTNREIEERRRIEEQKKKEKQQEIEKQRQKAEQQRRDEQRRIAAEKQKEQEIIEAENRRISDIQKKISKIRKRYKPTPLKTPVDGIQINVKKEYVNKDIVNTVNLHKEKICQLVEECKPIDSKINQILRCKKNDSVDQQYEFLTSQESYLTELKSKSDSLHTMIAQPKIQFYDYDDSIMSELTNCFSLLKNSERTTFRGTNSSAILCNKKPNELNLFVYKSEPVILYAKQNYYCLFSSFILVFNYDGAFSSALDPTALSISVTRMIENVTITNGESSKCKHVASDSKLISEGKTISTWEHTCLDGTPDLRYRNNLRTHCRTDTYEYGKIEFEISGVKFSCTTSSQKAIEAFEAIIPKYNVCYNNLHNSVPDFIKLLKLISDSDDENVDFIANRSRVYSENKNQFCEIIDT